MHDSSKPKLRLGLLLDSFTIHTWQHRMLQRIAASDYAEFHLVVLNDSPAVGPRKRRLYRLLGYTEAHLWRWYHRLKKDPSQPGWDPFTLVDSYELLKDVPVLKVQPKSTRHSDRFNTADIDTIRSHDIDVLIRIGFRILRGGILKVARHGVWSYHMSDNRVIRGGPPGFWEVIESHPVTGSVLQILSEKLEDGLIIYRSWSATHPYSIDRNRDNYYRKSLSFLPRKLKELYNLGPDRFFEQVQTENQPSKLDRGKLYKAPGNVRFIWLFVRYLAKYCRVMLSRLFFRDQWILLYNQKDEHPESLSEFKKLKPPRNRSWQDPCIVHEHGVHHVFVCEHGRKQGENHIALLSLDSDGKWQQAVPVLESPQGFAHPFVFNFDGSYYMIPSASNGGLIELFRATDFPMQWTFEKNLLENITAANATMFHHENRWYLFANVIENEGASINDELFLYSSDHPLSTRWMAHPQNPIVSDVRRARPAGRLFLANGNIYRAAQDNSTGHGHWVRVFQILCLSETQYREKEVEAITPGGHPKIRTVGTLVRSNGLAVASGRLRKARLF